jgi:hypothetical protein
MGFAIHERDYYTNGVDTKDLYTLAIVFGLCILFYMRTKSATLSKRNPCNTY